MPFLSLIKECYVVQIWNVYMLYTQDHCSIIFYCHFVIIDVLTMMETSIKGRFCAGKILKYCILGNICHSYCLQTSIRIQFRQLSNFIKMMSLILHQIFNKSLSLPWPECKVHFFVMLIMHSGVCH